MTRCFIGLLALGVLCGCSPAPAGIRDMADLRSAPIHSFSPAEMDAYLRHGAPQPANLPARVAHFGRKAIGQRCELFVLGEYPFELYDPQPMVCLTASDCVTFVEQTYAMALARDWPTFFAILQRIRYHNGVVGIRTRNHFTEADWNVHNRWLFDDVTGRLDLPTTDYTLRIDRPAFFDRFGLADEFEAETFDDAYIARDDLSQLSNRLQVSDVIEFVRGTPDAPYVGHVGHVGIVLRSPDGTATLLHSGRPAVHELPLRDYVAAHGGILGFKILRPQRDILHRTGDALISETAHENRHPVR